MNGSADWARSARTRQAGGARPKTDMTGLTWLWDAGCLGLETVATTDQAAMMA